MHLFEMKRNCHFIYKCSALCSVVLFAATVTFVYSLVEDDVGQKLGVFCAVPVAPLVFQVNYQQTSCFTLTTGNIRTIRTWSVFMVLYFTAANTFFSRWFCISRLQTRFFPDGFVFHDNKHVFFQMVLYFTTTNTFFSRWFCISRLQTRFFSRWFCISRQQTRFFPDGFVFHDNKHVFFQMVLYFTTTNTFFSRWFCISRQQTRFFPEGLYYLLIAKDAFASKLCMVMFTRIVSIILTAQVQRNC